MRTFGLIGKTLEHSFSPTYFARKFEELGLTDHEYVFFPIDEIEAFPEILNRSRDLAGLNVTIPYKRAIIPYLDALMPDAQEIGSVNTILFTPDGLVGANTDWIGFMRTLTAFEPDISSSTKALVLGTGGSSRAVRFALGLMGIPVLMVSREPKEGAIGYDALDKEILDAYNLLVQTTPVGMYPDASKSPNLPYHLLGERHLLYDLIYNPVETEFLRKGRERGARVINGYGMLEEQAEASWALWNQ